MAETGYIVVNTFTARRALPIANASVSILDTNKENPTLYALRITNESGLTQPFPLEAPNQDLSMRPSEETPFSVCNIRVDHEQYYTITIENVQVFANTTTLQNVEMIPLPEKSAVDKRARDFYITPQDL